ncbi:MAG: MipA/OmpV family protein [Rhizobiaceae bacterium]|nr:MipA/OmpV family protein [Rhizobiaceae bacterium]
MAADADIDPRRFGWFSGDWQLTVGASGFFAPDYEGDDKLSFNIVPLISLGKAGPEARFTSRNDNISFALIDEGQFRAGPTGKIIFGRDAGDSGDLGGLDEVKFGAEIGAFAEYYPTDWLRVRGELRHGIRSHHGVVGDVTADAFVDVAETLRVSAGPRLSFASADYMDAYYGISPSESAASGLPGYDPGSGIKSAGAGGAVTWKATDRITSSIFGEYARLVGDAADSPLVRERGSENQFTFGVSSTYRFDFAIP